MTPLRPTNVPPRRLSDLVSRVTPAPAVEGADVDVTGVTHDSRAVQPGDLYAALPGSRVHGAQFAADVATAGAAAILTDPAGREQAGATGLPVAVVDWPRGVLGALAAEVYDHPTRAVAVVGITGTNGKTTTAYLAEAALRAAGRVTGLIGTIETHIGGEVVPSVRTTPEAPDLQALFAVMRERGVTAVAMEVSSHALALGRVDGTRFAVGVFTNLSQDHLDFHADMDDYFRAKARLFDPDRTAAAVINTDDPAGRRLADSVTDIPVAGVGTGADWQIGDVDLARDGSTFTLRAPDGRSYDASVRLPGAFNVPNAAAAIVAAHLAGAEVADAIAGVAALTGVPGRMERVEAGQPFLAVVDYAHTPEAVETLLAAVRPAAAGRVIAVLGCGGDRDRAKRPLMGRALAAGADVAILTSDNPRSEDPAEILRAMAVGTEGATSEVVVEPDRAAAIRLAVARARAGDVVVIAGKGHEPGQEIGDLVLPFDDRDVLRTAISEALG